MPRASKRPPRLAHSLHESVLDLFAAATDSLRSAQDDEAVHAARKACKRIRAALRLLRGSLGEEAYRRENRAVRDAIRPLTVIRDVFVLRRTLRQLPRHPMTVQRDLDAQYRRERSRVRRHGARAALGRLARTCARLRGRPAGEPELASAAAGVQRVYRAGRKALARARSRDDGALHEWRKQTQYLLNQLDLLQEVFDARFGKMRRRAHEIEEALGVDHDLGVLQARLDRYREIDPAFTASIKNRRRALQRRAFHIGKRLYRPSAKQIEGRLTRRLS